MLELNARAFYGAVNGMRSIETIASRIKSTHNTPDGGVEIEFLQDEVLLSVIDENLSQLKTELVILGARLTLLEVDRLKDRICAKVVTFKDVSAAAASIRSRLADELSLTKVLVVETDMQRYFAPTQPLFGLDFANKFQHLGVFELDEAARCLALSRPTASVFHLMRLMELGIQALARCIQIPDPIKPSERNWGKILDSIKKNGIEKKWPTSAARASGDGELFEAMYASLDAVKNPWRNATMHVENKYTDDEAEHIFVAVRGFMKKLSARMDEDGNPLA